MRKTAALLALALSLALVGCTSAEVPQAPSETDEASQAVVLSDPSSPSTGQVVEAEPEPAPDQQGERAALAEAFAQTYYNSAVVLEDGDMEPLDGWRDACLAYIAPDSDLYQEFQPTDLSSQEEITETWGNPMVWFVLDHTEICYEAEDHVAVNVWYHAGNGIPEPSYWETAEPNKLTLIVFFDDANQISSLIVDYNEDGKG